MPNYDPIFIRWNSSRGWRNAGSYIQMKSGPHQRMLLLLKVSGHLTENLITIFEVQRGLRNKEIIKLSRTHPNGIVSNRAITTGQLVIARTLDHVDWKHPGNIKREKKKTHGIKWSAEVMGTKHIGVLVVESKTYSAGLNVKELFSAPNWTSSWSSRCFASSRRAFCFLNKLRCWTLSESSSRRYVHTSWSVLD